MNIIGKKNFYFIFSLIIIIPGLISLVVWGLPLSIDFTGGTRLTFSFQKEVDQKTLNTIKEVFKSENVEISTIQKSNKQVLIRTNAIDQKKDAKLVEILKKKTG